MLKIRLSKNGKKTQPFYKIIVIDQRKARQGKFISKLGYYNPINGIININIKDIDYWLLKGAKLTKRVKFIIKQHS